ncbi:MAG: hypothetical protein ACXACX_22985, partial [Candidatus Hodarchaeales archaeon]
MRKSRKNTLFLILIVTLVSFQFFPLLGLGEISSNNFSLNQLDVNKVDGSSLTLPNGEVSIQHESNSLIDSLKSVFDDNLRNSLHKLDISSHNDQNYMKVIFLFEDDAKKVQRIEVIDSIFDDYQIIDNYDLISGTYVKISPLELILKQDIIEGVQKIKKIYKSEVYESPYIIDDSLQLNALDIDFFSNWWLAAVGAESLSYDGSGVKVAVIDTGIFDHPALNIISNQNFVIYENKTATDYNDDVGHG